jgi:hypothetical protein
VPSRSRGRAKRNFDTVEAATTGRGRDHRHAAPGRVPGEWTPSEQHGPPSLGWGQVALPRAPCATQAGHRQGGHTRLAALSPPTGRTGQVRGMGPRFPGEGDTRRAWGRCCQPPDRSGASLPDPGVVGDVADVHPAAQGHGDGVAKGRVHRVEGGGGGVEGAETAAQDLRVASPVRQSAPGAQREYRICIWRAS